ncbi:tRNA (uracil-O(2)-)-methyltransferase [Tolypocladium ophioglossoides CBS 100239]|uniref:tRNA (uracil-O(2)-)-methyltransferase n=1 Tax=Tolypocladium ophioglossoides (strain CBS 100239) TaxID=1163406 RepID=A0A0L0MZS5_TOLOC|nr:tRNA (uracil-O(2)-)-methyltransferase [Tolypocladium ophioglossoides CBS 100239]
MPFEPEELPPATPPFFDDTAGDVWVPLYRHACTFGPDMFVDKMMNMVRNPNLNSSWLFRADIIYDDDPEAETSVESSTSNARPSPRDFTGIPRQRTLVRKLIPRNERRDQPLDQTCTFHRSESTTTPTRSLVLYIPHASSAPDLPFYHPKVRGIAHLHEWHPLQGSGSISVHFLPFQQDDLQDKKVRRTAYRLLEILHKHGQSSAAGYVKRVHHDVVIPQARFQDHYARLKNKYARQLVDSWAESTDPGKHVFEDLGIAAFLMELWADMYKDAAFPGFVDIGCGNGLLVYILTQEGYSGWGFDARARKSWAQFQTEASRSPSGQSLEQRLLLPSVVPGTTSPDAVQISPEAIHDGLFPPGTFIVSNHADELTPWTPILGAISQCPFIMIPCCSHNLTGEKYRAPPPRDKTKSKSTFASLVDWVTHIAEDCGWEIETEMLRIPSTRNTCLLGRRRTKDLDEVNMEALLRKYGGVEGYCANVAGLVKSGPRGH